MTQAITPTTQQERILSLDVLRGFTILGILIMNIQSFSMPGASYLIRWDLGDINYLVKSLGKEIPFWAF